MVAPVLAAAVPAIIDIGGRIIDKLWPDKDAADKAKVELYRLAQEGEFKAIEVELERFRLDAEDRGSARAREAQTGDTLTPRLLAGAITIGFFGVLGYLLGYGAPQHGGEALLVLLGSLGTGFAGVLSYYFGSSSGSRYKSDLIAKLEPPKK